MSKTLLKVKVMGSYDGHSIKPNQQVNLAFKFIRSDLEETIPLLATVNQTIEVLVKVGINKPISLGSYNFNGYSVNRNGEVTFKLQSDKDFVDENNLNKVTTNELITIMFKSDIELEENEDD